MKFELKYGIPFVSAIFKHGDKEFIYEKIIDSIKFGDVIVENFKIQIGAMNYGFGIKAILGMNFLMVVELFIDCGKLEIRK